MKQNILIVMIVLVFAVMLGFSLLILGGTKKSGPAPLDKSASSDQTLYQKEEAELDSFGEDLALSDQDASLSSEINQAFNDILDASESALDENSISEEVASLDFSEDLNSSSADEATLQEIDQSLAEATQ